MLLAVVVLTEIDGILLLKKANPIIKINTKAINLYKCFNGILLKIECYKEKFLSHSIFLTEIHFQKIFTTIV